MGFTFRTGDDVQTAHPTWYRGEICNFNPTKAALHAAGGLEEYVLKGWMPAEPFITRSHCITSFGSCFAMHVSRWLTRQQYQTGERLALLRGARYFSIGDSHVVRFGEGIVNTFAVRQQFEWALEGRRFSEELWFGARGELADYNEAIRDSTARLFRETDVFIITLGLSEVWYNRQSGDVFWRAIPRDKFDGSIHGFRVSTVQENVDNLTRIYQIIRRARPQATIIFTLSPVPLVATFRPVSCITANSVSKAILRVAVDELVRGCADSNVFYWPSYEIVKEYVEGAYLDDNRHLRPKVIDLIMRTFAQRFLVEPYSDEDMRDKEARARELFERVDGLDERAIRALLDCGVYDTAELTAIPRQAWLHLAGRTGVA